MATPKRTGADSVLDLTTQDFAALSDAAKDTIVELVERGGLFLGNAMLYATAYHTIAVSQYRAVSGKIERTTGTITVSVREYANTRHTNRAGNTPKVRLGLKDILLFGLPGMLKGHLDVDTGDGALTIGKDGKTLLTVGKREVNACFNGKGSPRMMARTIELLQIWLVLVGDVLGRSTVRATIGKKDARETHDYAIEDLQTMVDDYLGVDCNGFTGLYLKAKFPKLSVTSQTTEEAYVSREAHNRMTLADIKADDVVAFNDGSYHHVAMVGAVLLQLPGETLVLLCEARSANLVHGGPQSNVWRVRQHVIKDRWGRPTGKTEEGKFDIVGRSSDKFVKIASPDRFK